MTEIIELRPNKNLINSSFEKYQFSNEVIPIISENKLRHRKYIYVITYDYIPLARISSQRMQNLLTEKYFSCIQIRAKS